MVLLGKGRKWPFGIGTLLLKSWELLEGRVGIFNRLTRLSWEGFTFLSICVASCG